MFFAIPLQAAVAIHALFSNLCAVIYYIRRYSICHPSFITRTRLTISAIIIRVNRWRQLVPREFFSPLKIYNYIVIRICSVVRFICDIHRNHPQAAVIIISPACKAVICRFVHPPTSDIHKVSVRIHQTFLLEISHNIEHIRRIYSPGVIVYVHTVYRHLYAIHNKRLVQSYKCVLVIHLDRINIIRIVIIKC